MSSDLLARLDDEVWRWLVAAYLMNLAAPSLLEEGVDLVEEGPHACSSGRNRWFRLSSGTRRAPG